MHVIEVFFFERETSCFIFFFNVAFGYKRRTVFFFLFGHIGRSIPITTSLTISLNVQLPVKEFLREK